MSNGSLSSNCRECLEVVPDILSCVSSSTEAVAPDWALEDTCFEIKLIKLTEE